MKYHPADETAPSQIIGHFEITKAELQSWLNTPDDPVLLDLELTNNQYTLTLSFDNALDSIIH